jgi:hypothetical protein
MVLDMTLSVRVFMAALHYKGREFDWDTFNCVHFVRQVYKDVGIELPLLRRELLPPKEFHLNEKQFRDMPVGHSVFFKRRAKETERTWSHLAIILAPCKLIHCTRHMGNGVIISDTSDFLKIYELAQYE